MQASHYRIWSVLGNWHNIIVPLFSCGVHNTCGSELYIWVLDTLHMIQQIC